MPASPAPAAPSDGISLDAVVRGSATPTGTVSFQRDGQSVGSAAVDASGRARLSLPPQTLGVHQIRASYSGSDAALKSTAAPAPLNVAPAPPRNVTAAAGDGSAAVSWDASDGATSYRVLRDGTPVGATAQTSLADTGLANGTTYSYRVVATGEGGDSAPSASADATPQAAAVPVPIATVPPQATGVTTVPATPCARYQGVARSRCNARLARTRALAACRRLPTAARRSACARRTATRYAVAIHRLDLAGCRRLKTRAKRAACVVRADARYRGRLRALKR